MISAQQRPTLWAITTAAATDAVSSFFAPLVAIWSLLTDDQRTKRSSQNAATLDQAVGRIVRLEEDVANLRRLVKLDLDEEDILYAERPDWRGSHCSDQREPIYVGTDKVGYVLRNDAASAVQATQGGTVEKVWDLGVGLQGRVRPVSAGKPDRWRKS